MRFALVHKVASYLMVAAAFISLAMSQQLSKGVLIFTIVGGVASYFFDPKTDNIVGKKWWSSSWNALTFTLFGWTILDSIRGDLLPSGARFLCFLLLNKLWNRRTSSDYLQAYVVSFLMLLAGAALSSNLWYALCFLAYVIFSTWTLILFHLRREMEDNYLLKHQSHGGDASERVGVERILNSRRVVGGSFFAMTTLVSLGVFIGSALAFVVVPRIGLGFFFQKTRPGQTMVGFSERVELGEYGLVKSNPQVVMRIEFDKKYDNKPRRFRGVSFDHYNHGQWTRTITRDATSLRRIAGVQVPTDTGSDAPTEKNIRAALSHALVRHVYLDPLDTSVLFGATQPIGFELPPASVASASALQLEGRQAGDVYAYEQRVDPSGRGFRAERKSGIKYTVYSDETLPSEMALLKIPNTVAPPELKAYLQLPADFPQRVIDLAKRVTNRDDRPFLKAMAIGEYLREHLKYTLDLKRDQRYEPIEDFLFVQKAGHCEYFASTMAVMLRAVGVPARSVNGFAGGEWNSYGNYLAVRQGDAHTWVEAWMPGEGWVTFDPTPSRDGPPPKPTFSDRLRQMMDNLEMTWFKYVIEYDLAKQLDFLSNAKSLAKSPSRMQMPSLASLRRRAPLIALLALPLLYLLMRRRFRRRGSTHLPSGEAELALERAIGALHKRGLVRRSSETGRELAERAEAMRDPAAADFAELVQLYQKARYRHDAIATQTLDQLAERVERARIQP